MTKTEPIKILYMEDDRGLARLLQKKLNRIGFEVDFVHDGLEGIGRLGEAAYDVLIVDNKMPGLSGIEVISRLAGEERLPPTIMVTGAGDEKVAVEAMKLGAGDYMVKDSGGVYLELLPQVIENQLEQKRLRDAKEQAESKLCAAHENLEKLVQERTEALEKANRDLKAEIGERQKAEKRLREAGEGLERLVRERTEELEIKTKNLEELNIALKVLLKKREDDKEDLEKNFVDNITGLLLPYVEKLKNSRLETRQRFFVEIIESNIHEIVSPFARQLSSEYFKLTPTEIRVANLVKQEKTSKEIAEIQSTSESAIIYHRHNIRRKLGLRKKKVNLKTYLKSLE